MTHSIQSNLHSLTIDRLSVRFDTPDGQVRAVTDLSLELRRGATLAIVGESGSGKSQAMLAVLGLLAANARVRGQVRFDGVDLLSLPAARLNMVRGNRIAMIFQDPMTALNPYLRVGTQMTEVLTRHKGLTTAQAREKSIEALQSVHIPDAARRIDRYPHEFSGGMRQRVMIAMALLCDPDVLIADEPTTALDVTVQAEILGVLRDLQSKTGTSILFITHDLGVVAELCDEVAVMYGGRLIEQAEVHALFAAPRHPYTAALLAAVPRLDGQTPRLFNVPGHPPDLADLPQGCAFAPRCDRARELCRVHVPPLASMSPGRAACHFPLAARSAT